jgi:hypothetical protein
MLSGLEEKMLKHIFGGIQYGSLDGRKNQFVQGFCWSFDGFSPFSSIYLLCSLLIQFVFCFSVDS